VYPGPYIFLSKEHVMKRLFFPLLVLSLALILPALTGCPQDSGGDNIPSGYLGDGPLVLEGKVYTEIDMETIFTAGSKVTYPPYTAPDVVRVEVETLTGSETLGTWPLTNGEFNISIDRPSQPVRSSISEDHLFYGEWENLKVDPADAQIAAMYFYLEEAHTNLKKREQGISWNQADFTATIKEVCYVYADKDAVVTLGDTSFSEGPRTTTYKAGVLKLKKGWNALNYDTSIAGSISSMDISGSANFSVSVGNPDLKWVVSE
jgi:hypothetical protein